MIWQNKKSSPLFIKEQICAKVKVEVCADSRPQQHKHAIKNETTPSLIINVPDCIEVNKKEAVQREEYDRAFCLETFIRSSIERIQ